MAAVEVRNSSDNVVSNNDTTNYNFDHWDPFEFYRLEKWMSYAESIVFPIAVLGGVFT